MQKRRPKQKKKVLEESTLDRYFLNALYGLSAVNVISNIVIFIIVYSQSQHLFNLLSKPAYSIAGHSMVAVLFCLIFSFVRMLAGLWDKSFKTRTKTDLFMYSLVATVLLSMITGITIPD